MKFIKKLILCMWIIFTFSSAAQAKDNSIEVFAYQDDVAYYYENEKYGLMDVEGQKLTEAIFDKVSPFYSEVATVKSNDYWGVIDKTGQYVFEPASEISITFWDGYGIVKEKGHLWSLINTKGETIVEPTWYIWARPFGDGYFAVDNGEHTFFVGLNGQAAFGGAVWRDSYTFTDGMAAVQEDSNWGFINTRGELVIDYQYNYVDLFAQEYAAVSKPGEKYWYFIDKTGEKILEGKWEEAKGFGEFDLAPVMIKEKWGFINKNGKMVQNPKWDTAESFANGLACVSRNDKYGYIDKSGKVVMKLQWDYAAGFVNGYAYVEHIAGWEGYINTKGELVCRNIK